MNRTIGTHINLLLLAVLASAPSVADQPHRAGFLASSPVVRQSGLLIVPVSTDGRIIMIDPLPEKYRNQPIRLLSAAGTFHLQGDITTAVVKDEYGMYCGYEHRAAALTLQDNSHSLKATRYDGGNSDYLAVIGANVDTLIQWYPAERIEGPLSTCPPPVKAPRLEQLIIYRSDAFPQYLSWAKWRFDNRENQCSDESAYTVGVIDGAGHCLLLNSETHNCQAEADNRRIGPFIGALRLGGKETWLIFESAGYEWFGFEAFRFDPGDKSKRPQPTPIDTTYPWGC